MSWFTGLITGAGAGVSWLTQNSGTILQAATAIARAAGAIALEVDVEADSEVLGSVIADLQPNFNTATHNLLQQAKENAPDFELESAADVETRISNISGIWTSPGQADSTGEPPVGLYQDLCKFLYQEAVPYLFNDTSPEENLDGGKIFDAALEIGKAVFGSSLSGAALGGVVGADQNGVTNLPFNVSAPGEGVVYSGCHSFYALPMGDAGQQQALHGAIYLKATMTADFGQEQAELCRKMQLASISPPRSSSASTGANAARTNQWNITMQVPWTTCATARTASMKIPAFLGTNNPDLIVGYNQIQGACQVLKVQGDTARHTPSTIRSAVTQAVANAVSASLSSGPVPIIAGGLQIPDVHITSTTIVLTGSAGA